MNALTKLQAVNLLLQAIGEPPTNSLATNSGSIVAEVGQAITEIDTATRSLQLARPWSWCSDEGVTLSPDINGVIAVPANASKVDACDPRVDVVIRARPGGQMALWDRTARTFTFTAALKADVSYTYDFDALPEIAKEYVTRQASRRFQAKLNGDTAADQFNAAEEQRAWLALLKDDAATTDANLLNNCFVRRTAYGRR